MKTDRHLSRACYQWQQSDDMLAIAFKGHNLIKYVKRAVSELQDRDETEYGFETRCLELVEARDKRLRDKVLSLVSLEQNALKGQMEFDL